MLLSLFYKVRKRGLQKPRDLPNGSLRVGGKVQISKILKASDLAAGNSSCELSAIPQGGFRESRL